MCPNGEIMLGNKNTKQSTGNVTCSKGKFVMNNMPMSFEDTTCSKYANQLARKTGEKCLTKYDEVKIGFSFLDRSITLITVCFDSALQTAVYSENNITKAIMSRQIRYPRGNWDQGNIFNIKDVDNYYKRKTQISTINGLLGLELSSEKYVSNSSDFYLSRGHLTPNADFIYGSQQRATFQFANAVPQWQTFNGKNWCDLEEDVRDFVHRKKMDLTIYTGTHGISILPHEKTDKDIELYLYVKGNTKLMPVPRLFWKAVYEPITKAGVVFYGVNNPYANCTNERICNDICSQYSWLKWQADNATLGCGYCCSVEDFRKTVKTFPYIEVKKLLT